jgi:hypothetical protein
VLYVASKFMGWLLIGVFGFFGLHAALWLPRGFAERRRHAAGADHDASKPSAPAGGAKS